MGKRAEHWAKNKVFIDSRLKIVVMVLADYCNDDSKGLCWPSQAEIARIAGKSVRQIKRDVKDLNGLKIITVINHRVGKHKTINVYRLHWGTAFDILGNGTNMAPSKRELSLRDDILNSYQADPTEINFALEEDHARESKAYPQSFTPIDSNNWPPFAFEGDAHGPFKGDAHDTRQGTPTAPELPKELTTTNILNTNTRESETYSFPMSLDWSPSMSWLYELCIKPYGISLEFVAEELLDFKSYWILNRRVVTPESWQSRFRKQLVRNWKRNGNPATELPADFEPTTGTLEIIRDAMVSDGLVDEELPKFIEYWQEAGGVRESWQALFIKHIEHVARIKGQWIDSYYGVNHNEQ